MKKTRFYVQVAASIFLLAAGIGYAGYVSEGYRKGQIEYALIKDTYTSLADVSGSDPDKTPETKNPVLPETIPAGTGKISDQQESSRLLQELPADAPQRITVDWDALLQRNGDVIGWVYIPAVEISYPILKTQDNDYYLHRDIDGNYLYAGSIFLDASCDADFKGYNTILYGHNMRDGSMFARIKEFRDPETLHNCRYFWILTPSGDLLYEICSIHTTAPGSDSYLLRFDNSASYENWLKEMTACSEIDTALQLAAGDRIVTMSTCTDSSSQRIVLQGRLIWYSDRTAG